MVEEWGKSGSEQSSGGGGKKGSSGSVEKQRAKKTAESVNKIEEKIVRPLETTKKKSEHYNSSSGTKSSRPSGITKKQTNLSKVESTSVTNDKNLHEAKQKLKKHFENENIRTGGKIKDDLTRRQKIAEKDLEQRYIKKRKENPNDPWNLGGNTQSPYGPEYY